MKKVLRNVIFRAVNDHREKGSNPPQFDTTDQNQYCAYFENENREQFLFRYDYPSHTATLWLSKKGWNHPVDIVNGKANGVGLGRSEKAWLKACWNVTHTVQQRRASVQRLLTSDEPNKKLDTSNLPPHEELVAGMGHLFDFLARTDYAPNCVKTEFVYGWTNLIELTARLEAKYKEAENNAE